MSPSEHRDVVPTPLTGGARHALGIAGTVLLALVVMGMAVVAITRTGLFRVRSIETAGTRHVSRSEIIRLSGIARGDPTVWLDEELAEDKVERSPWVARADVRIDLPWTVTITVTERSPIAGYDRGSGTVLVAGDGTILSSGRLGGLPSIDAPPAWVDPGGMNAVRDAAKALAALGPDLREEVHRVVAGGPRGLEVLRTDGIRVLLGTPASLEEKAQMLADVLAWIDRSGQQVRTIDVSAPSAPALILVP